MTEKTEIKQRLAALRTNMQERQIDYCLIPTTDYHNSEYVDDFFKEREFFSAFTGSNGSLVISADEAGLWTDGRYFIQAEHELEGTGITLFRMQEEGVPSLEEYLQQNIKKGQCLGFDGRTVNAQYGHRLKGILEQKDGKIEADWDPADGIWLDRPAMPANPMFVLKDELAGKSLQEKLIAVRKSMQNLGAEYFLLTKLDDIMWLMNLRGRDVECNPVGLSYLWITRDELHFFVQEKAVPMEVRKYLDQNQVELHPYGAAYEFLKEYQFQGKVMCDLRYINYRFLTLIDGKTPWVFAKNPTEQMKAMKNEIELQNLQNYYIQDSVVLTKFIYWLKQNIGKTPLTEYSAAEKLDHMRSEIPGFVELSFPTISAYGPNAAMMHYRATEDNCSELKPEGMLLVDSGGQYMGGTTDVTRTIVLGEISSEIKKHFTLTCAGCLRLGAAKFLYGCSGRNLDILARQPLWEIGIDYKCGTGHGIGYLLNVHEGPQNIRWRFTENSPEAILEPGMIISDEPGVYIEGSHGIRTENIVETKLLEKNGDGQFMGFDFLTYVPIDLEGIEPAFLTEQDKELLNAYHEKVYETISPYLEKEEQNWLRDVTAAVK
ncbi:MAG: aminopeptidase P family protein [Lachnospiraceae bacterium]|nr:aminopeptidase P family protein [Lachnospiraceae bacterium]